MRKGKENRTINLSFKLEYLANAIGKDKAIGSVKGIKEETKL